MLHNLTNDWNLPEARKIAYDRSSNNIFVQVSGWGATLKVNDQFDVAAIYVEEVDTISVFEKTVQYTLAYLIKNKIFSYAIEVDENELPPDEFQNRTEQSLDFKIDEIYEDLETLFLQ